MKEERADCHELRTVDAGESNGVFRLLTAIVTLYIGLKLLQDRKHQAELLATGDEARLTLPTARRVVLLIAAVAFAMSGWSLWLFISAR